MQCCVLIFQREECKIYYSMIRILFYFPDAKEKQKSLEAEAGGLREYHCPVCDKVLQLSSIDILRHKRTHAQKSQSK